MHAELLRDGPDARAQRLRGDLAAEDPPARRVHVAAAVEVLVDRLEVQQPEELVDRALVGPAQRRGLGDLHRKPSPASASREGRVRRSRASWAVEPTSRPSSVKTRALISDRPPVARGACWS